MKFSAILATLALTATSTVALPAEVNVGELNTRALPGLNEMQTKNAKAIIARVKKARFGSHACQAAIATALVESTLIMHSNPIVPESMQYHYDRLGYDGDSVGLFQQRALYYTNIKCSMNPGCSTGQFLKDMRKVEGFKGIDVGTLCQKIQRSQFPDRYHKFVPDAIRICKASGL